MSLQLSGSLTGLDSVRCPQLKYLAIIWGCLWGQQLVLFHMAFLIGIAWTFYKVGVVFEEVKKGC